MNSASQVLFHKEKHSLMKTQDIVPFFAFSIVQHKHRRITKSNERDIYFLFLNIEDTNKRVETDK